MRTKKWYGVLLFGCLVSFSAYARSSKLAIPEELKAKYQYLFQQQVVHNPDGSSSFDKARLFKREGINVLYVKGDLFEMAYQHGRLLKNEILQGAIPQTANMISQIITKTLGDRPLLVDLVEFFIELTITNPLINVLTQSSEQGAAPLLAQAFALSESTSMEPETILKAFLAADIYMLLAAKTTKESNTSSEPAQYLNNCSDFAAWGDFTSDGGMVIGRNLDYPLNGYYDRFPTVVYFDPTEKDSQKYLSVVSAGVHNAGLTAINESGIFLGAHTVPTDDVGSKGKPIFAIANEVIRVARTFDEAVELFKKYPPISGYTYTLVSAREKRAAGIEMSHKHMAIRQSPFEYHIQTNHYMVEGMKPYNLYVNHSIFEDSEARYDRIKQVLEGNYARVGEKVAMMALGDKWDPYNKQVRGIGNTVAVYTTMTSAVFLPDKDKIYVSNGMAPVSVGQFVSFPLFKSFNADTFQLSPYEIVDNRSFRQVYPSLAEAEQLFIEATKAYEFNYDVPGAISYMKQVISKDPGNPNYHFMLGILLTKKKQYEEARKEFTHLIETEGLSHIRRLAYYYRGRVLAQEGYRHEASDDFSVVADDEQADFKLQQAARKAKKKNQLQLWYSIGPFELNLIMQFADMQSY